MILHVHCELINDSSQVIPTQVISQVTASGEKEKLIDLRDPMGFCMKVMCVAFDKII